MSNILDNALEACEKIEGKKSISIDSVLQKQIWILSVKNPVKKEVRIQKNRIATTKINREIHGYGIENIERITNKYKGNLKLECTNGMFHVKATLLLEK